MPLKDPDARRAYSKAQYMLKREACILASKKRRLRLQAEKAARKAAETLLPKPIVQRSCKDCGKDITAYYAPKQGLHCKECVAVYNREYREAHAKGIAYTKLVWKERNCAHVEVKAREYAHKNPERKAAARKKWDAANPGRSAAAKAKNAVERKKRVPAWLSEDDIWLIEQAYVLAALRTTLFGFPWHVDHIVPLNGRKVSGLHVPTNLQVITGLENMRKGAQFVVGGGA